FFFKKSKAQASSLSTQEIPLVDFSNLPSSSQDENNEISSATKISTLVETSNLSNLNNVLENNLEHENQDEIFYSKCDLSCCNSSNPYHPVTEDELALTVVDKRSCQKKWFLDYPWLTFCKVQNKVFCYPCRVAFERAIHPNTSTLNSTYKSFLA
ncbi:unnamed protein product, partial [Didymodactylos carnosus]